jgi:hypothetical protein
VAAGTLVLLCHPAAATSSSHTLRTFQYASPIPSACEAVRIAGQPAALPFTGIILDPLTSKEQGRPVQFSRGFWGGGPPDPALIDGERRCLEQVRAGPFPLNLIRVAVLPGMTDWFDDWTPIWDRVDLLGMFMQSGGIRGIFFDPELYGDHSPVFTYRQQKYASSRSFEAYARQSFRRGGELMDRLQRIRQDIVIVFAFAFEQAWFESLKGTAPARARYGLLPPFLNGVIARSGRQVQLIDGYELAYGFRTEVEFVAARQVFDLAVLPLVDSPERYRARFRLGFGIWLNYDWQHLGWSAAAPERNYYSPEGFTNWLAWARRYSDGFAWTYTERLDWLDPAQVPSVYVKILATLSGR